MPVDEQRLKAFLGKSVGDLGAAVSAVLMSIGDELGFYKALAAGPLTAAELAARTGTHERYVREWLANQAAGGYVEYDAAAGTFALSPEQALCLADPDGPVDLPGAYSIVRDLFHIRDRAMENFRGIDYHATSIEIARTRAQAAGVSNVRFEVADATSYNGGRYDLIAFFDSVHDMADPAGAARHARQSLAPDGQVMLVEPFAQDRLEENLNPVGRVYYGASALVCVPVSLAKKGPALGAQAGEGRLREVFVNQGGFTRFRRATETPFNLVLEARP